MKKPLHINADMGELQENESLLMPYLDACNIACGGHIGDADSMADSVRLAIRHRVTIGAHPSYPDRINFGRKSLKIDASELIMHLHQQVDELLEITKQHSTTLAHIKPHGALYNDAVKNEKIAEVIIELCQKFPGVTLFVPPQSLVEKLARASNIHTIREAFIDRKYLSDGSLMPRSKNGAVIDDPAAASEQAQSIWMQEIVQTDSDPINISADTLCVHGDNPAAVAILKNIRNEFPKNV